MKKNKHGLNQLFYSVFCAVAILLVFACSDKSEEKNIPSSDANMEAYSLYKEGRISEAIEKLRKISPEKRDYVLLLNALAAKWQSDRDAKVREEAHRHMAEYEKLYLRSDPGGTHYTLGGSLVLFGDFKEAISHYKKAEEYINDRLKTEKEPLRSKLLAQRNGIDRLIRYLEDKGNYQKPEPVMLKELAEIMQDIRRAMHGEEKKQ
jgi:tetratricopeptide (TPR) repeat protein